MESRDVIRQERVAAFYLFSPMSDIAAWQPELLQKCRDLNLRGTILLAPEGINGTVSGQDAALDRLLEYLRQRPELASLQAKFSFAHRAISRRMKVKLKREIVSFDLPGFNPVSRAGTYVKPEDWNEVLADPDVVCIDTRNDYEVAVGQFTGAINPKTQSFKAFTEYVQQHLDPAKHRKVAMYCTGGIRCEKATAWMRDRGFAEVLHLEGGILKYLEVVPPEQSRWQGECFVFDERVTVGHDLQPGSYESCHACRMAVSAADKLQPTFEHGVSCPHCYGTHSEAQLAAFRERALQMRLAKARGEDHLAPRPLAVGQH